MMGARLPRGKMTKDFLTFLNGLHLWSAYLS